MELLLARKEVRELSGVLKNKHNRTALDVAKTAEIRAMIANASVTLASTSASSSLSLSSSSSSSSSSNLKLTLALDPAEAARRTALAAANRLKTPIEGTFLFSGTGQKLHQAASKGDLSALTRRLDKWMGHSVVNW